MAQAVRHMAICTLLWSRGEEKTEEEPRSRVKWRRTIAAAATDSVMSSRSNLDSGGLKEEAQHSISELTKLQVVFMETQCVN